MTKVSLESFEIKDVLFYAIGYIGALILIVPMMANMEAATGAFLGLVLMMLVAVGAYSALQLSMHFQGEKDTGTMLAWVSSGVILVIGLVVASVVTEGSLYSKFVGAFLHFFIVFAATGLTIKFTRDSY
jgi:lysylphosphatidylglycerol synthetase-like protein (DUF2156 family)